MSISSGRSARDLAGAIGRQATWRAKEVLVGVVGNNGDGKRPERGRVHSGKGMRGLGLVSFPYVAIKEKPERRPWQLSSSCAAPLIVL
jgi:hypothetical protein